jgi:hypothetical protein
MICEPMPVPPSSCIFPALTFSPIIETNRTLIVAHVGANGFKSMDFAFWLVFSTKVKKPYIVESGIVKWTGPTNFILDIPNPERR